MKQKNKSDQVMLKTEKSVKKAIVLKTYTSSNPDPIEFNQGALLTLGKRDPQWPGWIWCTNAAGKSGWVPEKYLLLQNQTALALLNYCARELSVDLNTILNVFDEESGWYWVETMDGETGWVPADQLRMASSDQEFPESKTR